MGFTNDSLLIARDKFLKCRKHLWLLYNPEINVEREWSEYEWIIPLYFVAMSHDKEFENEHTIEGHVLKLDFVSSNRRKKVEHFILSNIGIKVKPTWKKWQSKLKEKIEQPAKPMATLSAAVSADDTLKAMKVERFRRQSVAFEQLKMGGAGTSTAAKACDAFESYKRDPTGSAQQLANEKSEFWETIKTILLRICAFCLCCCPHLRNIKK